METVTLPSHNLIPAKIPKEDNQVCTTNFDSIDKKVLAQFAGVSAAIFVLLQIFGTLFQIFILEQRLLDSGEKGACFLMILFNIIKIAYTMTLIFYLFILAPSNIGTVKTASFAITAAQIGVSIYLIITQYKKYKNPEDPETISDLWALLMSGIYSLELIVFATMITSFFAIIFNTNEPAQKRLAAQKYVYYYAPQTLNQDNLKASLVNYSMV